MILGFGSRDERRTEQGASHLFEHMVMRQYHDKLRLIESVGGRFSAFTGYETIEFHCSVPSRYWRAIVEFLAELISVSNFDHGQVKSEVSIILDEIESSGLSSQEQFLSKFFAGHPLGRSIFGTPDTVSAIMGFQLREFVSSHIATAPIALSVAGDIDIDEIGAICKVSFEKLVHPTFRKQRRHPFKFKAAFSIDESDPESDTVETILGVIVPGRFTPGYWAFILVYTLIGSDFLPESVSFGLRSKFSIYKAYTEHIEFEELGVLFIYFESSRALCDKAIEEMKQRFHTLSEGFTQEQLSRAKAQLIGQIQIGLDDIEETNVRVAFDLINFGHPLEVETIVNQIDQVTVNKVNELCRQYLDWKNVCLLKTS
tara:strand:+ start:213484 stop:214596 length:1113 start_codon:yes stop_codon:yes gene_type:complete